MEKRQAEAVCVGGRDAFRPLKGKRKGTGTESGSLSRNILRRSLCGFSRSVRNHNYLPGKAVGKASVCRLAVVVEVPQTYR